MTRFFRVFLCLDLMYISGSSKSLSTFRLLPTLWKIIGSSLLVAGSWALLFFPLGQTNPSLCLGVAQGLSLGLAWINGFWLLLPITLALTIAAGGMGLSWGDAIGVAGLCSGGVYLALRGLRFWHFLPHWQRLQDGIVFLLMGVTAPALMTALGGVALDTWGGGNWGSSDVIWLGSSCGFLWVTPILLRWHYRQRPSWQQFSRRHWLELGIAVALMLNLTWGLWHHHRTDVIGAFIQHQFWALFPFPLVVWASIRFPQWGGSLITCFLAAWAIAASLMALQAGAANPVEISERIFLHQRFFGVLATTGLLLSVTIIERQRGEQKLRDSWQRERLLAQVAQRVRESLELPHIFQTTVEGVRQLLQADRVYIALLNSRQQLEVRAEDCDPRFPTVLGDATAPFRYEEMIQILPTETLVAHDPSQFPAGEALAQYFAHYQVQALLAVPLTTQQGALGIVVAHHCQRPHHWQRGEVRLLEQLTTQVVIAVQQATLLQQVQQFNTSLEQQVSERTAQLAERMAELEELNQMKTLYVQAISHDLRTSVMGWLMLLKNLQASNQAAVTLTAPILERLIQNGDRQLLLLNALATEQASETPSLHLNCTVIDPLPWLETLVQHWQPQCDRQQVILKVDCPPSLPAIWGDGKCLEQVFDNLFTNALKHNPPGIELTLTAEPDGAYIRLTLSDTGIGMAPEQCHQLFQLYVRNLHNQRLTGIGLGCYQSRQIIEAHGGKIGVSSAVGEGSQFWFTLPLAE